MALKRRTKVSANFSMSSMTDIVFLLLIFFMVTSTLVHPNAIKLLVPKKSNTPTAVKEYATVRVTASGTYYINGRTASADALESKLLDALSSSENQAIKLVTDKTVSTGMAAIVLDIAESNSIKVILDIK